MYQNYCQIYMSIYTHLSAALQLTHTQHIYSKTAPYPQLMDYNSRFDFKLLEYVVNQMRLRWHICGCFVYMHCDNNLLLRVKTKIATLYCWLARPHPFPNTRRCFWVAVFIKFLFWVFVTASSLLFFLAKATANGINQNGWLHQFTFCIHTLTLN